MNTYTVYFAYTSERQPVTAPDWKAALRSTGRPDACLLDKRTCLTTGRVCVDATFNAPTPATITCRPRQADDASLKSWALACVAHEIQAANAGAGEVVEWQA